MAEGPGGAVLQQPAHADVCARRVRVVLSGSRASVSHSPTHERVSFLHFLLTASIWPVFNTQQLHILRVVARSTVCMANSVWAQVVRDVCARKPAEQVPQHSEPQHSEDADFEHPLFASHTPANGLTPALQAIAALIDEDDGHPEPSRPSKRKAESLGEAQVCLALTGMGAASAQPQRRQRVGTDAAAAMQP